MVSIRSSISHITATGLPQSFSHSNIPIKVSLSLFFFKSHPSMSTWSSYLIFSQSYLVTIQKEVPARQHSHSPIPIAQRLSTMPGILTWLLQGVLMSSKSRGTAWIPCLLFRFDWSFWKAPVWSEYMGLFWTQSITERKPCGYSFAKPPFSYWSVHKLWEMQSPQRVWLFGQICGIIMAWAADRTAVQLSHCADANQL